jgi:hypothetical protein
MSTEQSQKLKINFGELTSYLTYDQSTLSSLRKYHRTLHKQAPQPPRVSQDHFF